MKSSRPFGRTRAGALALAVGAVVVGAGILVNESIGSDHQQTAFTELNPRLDITDVFVFPGSSDDRIVLGMTVASPIVGAQGAFFDPNALYEFKVDNNQDGVPDVVLQFLFDDMSDGTQRVSMIGPVVANSQVDSLPGPFSGMLPGGISNRIIAASPVITRQALDTNLSADLAAGNGATAGQLQLFAGLRDDPFYIDLEQFFRIIPDRRPVEGPLAGITKSANAFRPDCGPDNVLDPSEVGPFDPDHGCAVDTLRGFNALAIVVELPESQLTRGRGDGQLGIWATISR
jgi:hypothetical protein